MKTKELMMGIGLVALFAAETAKAEDGYVVSCRREQENSIVDQFYVTKTLDGKYRYVASKCKNLPFMPCSGDDAVLTYKNSGEVEPDIYNGQLTGAFHNDEVRTYSAYLHYFFSDERNKVYFAFGPQHCHFALE